MATKETGQVSRATELLIVTKNELGALAKITTPLARNNINIECFSGYEWCTEAAFRLVTDNNRKAQELLKTQGYNVQENPVCLWKTDNVPGRLSSATTALAEANVNTFSAYATSATGARTQTITLNTSDVERTTTVLRRIC